MNLIFIMLSLIIISYLFVHLLKKVKIPEVVSLLLIGIFFGYPSIQTFIIGNNIGYVELLGTLGLFALMFLAGLESSWEKLKKEEYDAIHIALLSSLTPLTLGFIVVYFFLDYTAIQAFIVALCLSITAESAKARVLLELDVLKSKVASALVGAGILDDVLGIVLFSSVLFFLGVVDIHEHVILLGVIMSFVVGLLVQKFAREHHLTKKVEIFSTVCIIPFFFISTGMKFTLEALSSSLFLVFVILILGIGGKLLGSFLSKPFVNFSFHQLHLIGWAMNSRGALDIALAVIAFTAGIITPELFSSLVILALVSTMLFPFIVEIFVRKQPSIMD